MTDPLRAAHDAHEMDRLTRGRPLADAEVACYIADHQTALRHGTARVGDEIAEMLRDRASLAADTARPDRCPVCGTPGRIVSDDEGTTYFAAEARPDLDVEVEPNGHHHPQEICEPCWKAGHDVGDARPGLDDPEWLNRIAAEMRPALDAEHAERYVDVRAVIEYADIRTRAGDIDGNDGVWMREADWNRVVAVARGHKSEAARRIIEQVIGGDITTDHPAALAADTARPGLDEPQMRHDLSVGGKPGEYVCNVVAFGPRKTSRVTGRGTTVLAAIQDAYARLTEARP